MPGCLTDFLDQCERPVVYGSDDCCTAVADAVAHHYGFDIMAGWRGRYRTALGFNRIIRKAGFATFEEAYEATCIEAGLTETAEPQNWALGLIRFMDGSKRCTAPAFYLDGFWHGRASGGPIISEKVIKAWQQQPR